MCDEPKLYLSFKMQLKCELPDEFERMTYHFFVLSKHFVQIAIIYWNAESDPTTFNATGLVVAIVPVTKSSFYTCFPN